MAISYKYYKGSPSGDIIEASGSHSASGTQALVELSHCGVCGSDEHFRRADQGLGHEGVGIIKALGENAGRLSSLKVGDRVGLGWMQKFCGYCDPCLSGRHFKCENSEQFGSSNLGQGCFGTSVTWDVTALTKIPDEIPSKFAGPLLCGGASVWSPLYEHGMKAGERVGIVGVGGLGHLAIQFASKLGFEPVVFSTTESKKSEAFGFGATEFHCTSGTDKLQGVAPLKHLLITTSLLPSLEPYIPVLAPFAKIFPLTVQFDSFPIPLMPLILQGLSVVGSAGAHPLSMRAMLDFAAKHNIRPQIEEFTLSVSGVTNAMQKLKDGDMRYRGVLVI